MHFFSASASPLTAHRREMRELLEAASGTAELAALCDDWDGHVREAALHRCAALARPDLAGIVIARLNDWVPQVRQAARAAFSILAPLMAPDAILDAMPAILRLRMATRDNHDAWITTVEQELCARVSSDFLLDRARSGPIDVFRVCFHLLQRHELISRQELVALALARRDDIATARTAMYLCAALPEAERIALWGKALQSHFGAIRTIALRATLFREDYPEKVALAKNALVDTQPTMRDAAIYFLSQQGFDLTSYFRVQIQSAPDSAARALSITALGKCRHPEDAKFIRDYVHASSVPVRAAALTTWLQLAPAEKDEIALHAIGDVSPRIRRIGVSIIQRHQAYVPQSVVVAAMARTNDWALLALLTSLPAWPWMEAATRLLAAGPMNDSRRKTLAREFARRLHPFYEPGSPLPAQLALMRTPAAKAALLALLEDEPAAAKRLQQVLVEA